MTGTRPQTIREELATARFGRDATMLNLSLGALVVGTLYWNPAIWANDYPPDVKEAYGPPRPEEKRLALLVAIPFFFIGIGGPIWSTRQLKRRNGGRLSFAAAFAHVFGLILSNWLLDLTVLDWIMFVTFTPDFVVLPGTEGMAGYGDYLFHLRAHMKALPMLAVASASIALLVILLPVRSRAR